MFKADRSQLLFKEFRTFLIGVKQAFQICQVIQGEPHRMRLQSIGREIS